MLPCVALEEQSMTSIMSAIELNVLADVLDCEEAYEFLSDKSMTKDMFD
jgi:hypothetical protein